MMNIPGQGWKELKQELMARWNELTESDLDKTQGQRESMAELLERKIGMKIEDASEHFEAMAERFHLYDEPHERPSDLSKNEKERKLELAPDDPPHKDRIPKRDEKSL